MNKNEMDEISRVNRELEFQKVEIVTLRAELKLSKKENLIQNEQKQERASELLIANKDLVLRKSEKSKQIEALIIANEKLDFQKGEKQKRANELLVANKELAFQYNQKKKRADELLNANKELASQKSIKQKWVDQLLTANNELAFEYSRKQKQDDELISLQKELTFQYELKRQLASELNIAYSDLMKTEEALRKHIKGLENMMFKMSHEIRQPIAQILGISMLLDEATAYSPAELKKLISYLKPSVLDLDKFTREFTGFMESISTKKNSNAIAPVPK